MVDLLNGLSGFFFLAGHEIELWWVYPNEENEEQKDESVEEGLDKEDYSPSFICFETSNVFFVGQNTSNNGGEENADLEEGEGDGLRDAEPL